MATITGYAWTVLDADGTGLTTGDLTDANTSTPSFTAPQVSAQALIVLQLEVTQDDAQTDTDTVTITVNNVVAPFKVWDGSAWQDGAAVKVRSGGAWV